MTFLIKLYDDRKIESRGEWNREREFLPHKLFEKVYSFQLHARGAAQYSVWLAVIGMNAIE